ncbi:MAG: hypothetical protein U0841_11385 [Chloroflexia bacterium]
MADALRSRLGNAGDAADRGREEFGGIAGECGAEDQDEPGGEQGRGKAEVFAADPPGCLPAVGDWIVDFGLAAGTTDDEHASVQKRESRLLEVQRGWIRRCPRGAGLRIEPLGDLELLKFVVVVWWPAHDQHFTAGEGCGSVSGARRQ